MIAELFLVAMLRSAQDPAARPAPDASVPAASVPDVSVEDEVLANVKALEIPPVHVEDLALPEEFLRRVSDRIIRGSYEEHFRIVLPDPKPGEDAQHAGHATPPAGTGFATRAPLALIIAVVGGALCLWLFVTMVRRRKAGAR